MAVTVATARTLSFTDAEAELATEALNILAQIAQNAPEDWASPQIVLNGSSRVLTKSEIMVYRDLYANAVEPAVTAADGEASNP